MSVDRLDYYFDFLSPYAYFAWPRAKAACAARGLELAPHPVLLAGLLNHWGQLGPAEVPPKREFTFKDCFRYAGLHGIPFIGPTSHPFNPLLVLRLASKEVAGDQQIAVIDALWHAVWGVGIDPASAAEVTAALDAAGLEGATLVAKAQTPPAKEALRLETAAALEHQVFGVPTFIAGGELFWGNDRIDSLERYLDGKDTVDEQALSVFRSRPSSVQRVKPSQTAGG